MRKHVLVLTTTAVILTYGAIAVSAQAPEVQTPGTQSPTSNSFQESPRSRSRRHCNPEPKAAKRKTIRTVTTIIPA